MKVATNFFEQMIAAQKSAEELHARLEADLRAQGLEIVRVVHDSYEVRVIQEPPA